LEQKHNKIPKVGFLGRVSQGAAFFLWLNGFFFQLPGGQLGKKATLFSRLASLFFMVGAPFFCDWGAFFCG